MKILVWPAAGIPGAEIADCLSATKGVELYAGTDATTSLCDARYQGEVQLPHARSEGADWRSEFSSLADRFDLVFPAHDYVLDLIARFGDATEGKFVAPERVAIQRTRSKQITYQMLASELRVPELTPAGSIPARWPAYGKPDSGYGGQRHQFVASVEEWSLAQGSSPDLLWMEYLPGREFTMECYSLFNNDLVYASARNRERVRMGTSLTLSAAPGVVQEELADWARRISRIMPMRGPWYLQAREAADGRLTLLEVGARFPGSAVWSRAQGVNLAELALYEWTGSAIRVEPNSHTVNIERSLGSRITSGLEFGTLYIDLDDTILQRGHVSPEAIRLLAACKVAGKKVVVLSRYLGASLQAVLHDTGLQSFVDASVHVRDGSSKAAHIAEPDAIFIDDSFAERSDVRNTLGIPCFGPEAMSLIQPTGGQ